MWRHLWEGFVVWELLEMKLIFWRILWRLFVHSILCWGCSGCHLSYQLGGGTNIGKNFEVKEICSGGLTNILKKYLQKLAWSALTSMKLSMAVWLCSPVSCQTNGKTDISYRTAISSISEHRTQFWLLPKKQNQSCCSTSSGKVDETIIYNLGTQLFLFVCGTLFDVKINREIGIKQKLLMLWPLAVTPGITHFGAYHRPPGGIFLFVCGTLLDVKINFEIGIKQKHTDDASTCL